MNREFIRVDINFRESFRSSFSDANNHNSNRSNADRHRKRRNWPCNYAARNDCTDPPETLFLPVPRRSFQGTVDFSRKFLEQRLDVVAACIEAAWLTNWPRCATWSVDEQQKLVTLNPRAPRLPRTCYYFYPPCYTRARVDLAMGSSSNTSIPLNRGDIWYERFTLLANHSITAPSDAQLY